MITSKVIDDKISICCLWI